MTPPAARELEAGALCMTPKPPILCYVTDRFALGGEAALPAVIRSALAAGLDWIQIREKTLPTRRLLELTRRAVQDAHDAGADGPRIIVNDRLDVALAAAAHGVHLAGMSMPVSEVQRWLRSSQAFTPRTPTAAEPARVPPGFLVGRSCHSLMEAQQAERDGASYVILGPIFSTPSKLELGEPLGVARLAEACRALRIPVLAIGGITVETAAECLSAGAAGLAAIRLFQASPQLPEIVARLKKT
ncbi:MAG: thiamine phosphate synthase [Candidatus Acidiferrales bacterium]